LWPPAASTALIHYRLADERVTAVVELGRALLHDNAEHIDACARVDGPGC